MVVLKQMLTKQTHINNAMNKSSKGISLWYRKLRVDATQTEDALNSLGSGHLDRLAAAVRDGWMTSVIG